MASTDIFTKFEELYYNLNQEQKNAVDSIEGPVLVIAGPGTGKTQLLSMRVANILKLTDVLPQNILCLTFTDSAAYNMRTRLRSIIGIEGDKVMVNTFHGIGTEIINANQDYFYKGADFAPADDLARVEIIQDILSELDSQDPLSSFHPEQGWVYAKDIISRISDLKKSGFSPDDFQLLIDENILSIESLNPLFGQLFNRDLKAITEVEYNEFYSLVKTHVLKYNKIDSIKVFQPWSSLFLTSLEQALEAASSTGKFQKKFLTEWRNLYGKKDDNNLFQLKDALLVAKHSSLAKIYTKYQSKMHSEGLFDFDDMLLDVIGGLKKHSDLRYNYQEQFQYILVDEFQDTNGAQMELINSFINKEITNNRPNILVVGDDDQSVYKFQGANIQNIISFREQFDDVNTITLNTNYRSTQDILDFSSSIIKYSSQRLAHQDGINKNLISNKA